MTGQENILIELAKCEREVNCARARVQSVTNGIKDKKVLSQATRAIQGGENLTRAINELKILIRQSNG